jgi:hypothetical protein
MPFRKNFPDRGNARRLRALTGSTQGVPIDLDNPLPHVNRQSTTGTASPSSVTVSEPPINLAWKNDPDPIVVGPAPIQPLLEDFDLSEGTVESLPKTFFDPEGLAPWTTTNHNLYAIYALVLTAFFIAVFDRDIHISFAYDMGFLACGFVGIIPFGIFLVLAGPLEKRMRSALNTDYRRYLSYLSACKKYRGDKNSHDKEIADYNHRLEKRQEAYWRSLSGVAFERELEKLFSLMGYKVTLTPSTGDGGVDLLLRKDRTLTVIQCKAHVGRIPIGVARELSASMVDFHADDAMIACFDGVTGPVAEYIKTRRISVLDLNTILVLQRQFG